MECLATWISIAAPYSTVLWNASFIVRGCFIFFILWLVVWVKVILAGEDLPPPPFLVIFRVHGYFMKILQMEPRFTNNETKPSALLMLVNSMRDQVS
jgi:hypothetical protein